MATIKSYTSLEQSRKLAEFLPFESADMSWVSCDDGQQKYYQAENRKIVLNYEKKHWIPCWSLAALLGILPKKFYPIKDHETDLILGKPKDKWCALYWDATGMQDGEQTLADNPVDACYEMILKLHELNVVIMKQLTIEEKAKAYDEALKVLHKYDGANIMFSQSLKEEMFPELAESEDERIKKALIQNLKEKFGTKGTMGEGLDMPNVLAWLEKQGEQKPVDNKMPCNPDKCIYVQKYREKQKPSWSEEDERHVNSLLKRLKGLCRNEFERTRFAINEDEDWLKSLKDRVQLQPKQEWSEEDKTMLCYMEGHLEYLKNDKGYSSSEDQIMLKRQLEWLKSLRPQNTWKPSEEQMIALDSAIHCYSGISPTNNREVYALEIMKEQLKKLREE